MGRGQITSCVRVSGSLREFVHDCVRLWGMLGLMGTYRHNWQTKGYIMSVWNAHVGYHFATWYPMCCIYCNMISRPEPFVCTSTTMILQTHEIWDSVPPTKWISRPASGTNILRFPDLILRILFGISFISLKKCYGGMMVSSDCSAVLRF